MFGTRSQKTEYLQYCCKGNVFTFKFQSNSGMFTISLSKNNAAETLGNLTSSYDISFLIKSKNPINLDFSNNCVTLDSNVESITIYHGEKIIYKNESLFF